jgi:hypothetical protein
MARVMDVGSRSISDIEQQSTSIYEYALQTRFAP